MLLIFTLGLPVHQDQQGSDRVEAGVYKPWARGIRSVYMRSRPKQQNSGGSLNAGREEHTLPFFPLVAFTKEEAASEALELKEKRCLPMMDNLIRRGNHMVVVNFSLDLFHGFESTALGHPMSV
jgi:hypothetical protein